MTFFYNSFGHFTIRSKRDAKPNKGSHNTKTQKGKRKKGLNSDVPQYVDDKQMYGDMDEPDPESREYIYDDIDEFHATREKVCLMLK